MKLITKPIYQCDFCDKKLYKVGAMQNHEEYCFKNPKNIAICGDCEHCKEIKVEYIFDTYYGEEHKETKGFKCEAKNIELYPVKCERMGLTHKYPETFFEKERMPSECDLFEKAKLPF